MELKKTLVIAYLTASLLALIPIGISLLDSSKRIYHAIPTCPSKKLGKSCILCGSTSAYYQLSSGNWREAQTSSPLAVWIYILSIFNLFVLYSLRRYVHSSLSEGISL